MKTALKEQEIIDEELAEEFERALKCQMCNQIISGYDFEACITEHGVTHTIFHKQKMYELDY
ncbi:hypothetical protein MCHI_000989 [Candidatus Magnetoovum chiemensis]|nr:hypothetical protein MCHI_000989 [Candidatus Magnetoovum chiemensis]